MEKTGVIKPKYKLAGFPTPVPGVSQKRLFWVLTSSNYYHKRYTVEILPSHWENCVSPALRARTGYAIVHKTVQHSNAELILMRANPQNAFKYCARLCDSKFQEFLDKIMKLKLGGPITVPELTKLTASATTPQDIDSILKKLHL